MKGTLHLAEEGYWEVCYTEPGEIYNGEWVAVFPVKQSIFGHADDELMKTFVDGMEVEFTIETIATGGDEFDIVDMDVAVIQS